MKAIPAGELLPQVCEYVSEKTQMRVEPILTQGFIIATGSGDMVGAVLISMYRGFDCHVSAAVETPLAWSIPVRRVLANYVFGQLGCVRATAITKKRNVRARRALEAAGFHLEGNLRLGYDGSKDALVYGLLASDCVYFQGSKEV